MSRDATSEDEMQAIGKGILNELMGNDLMKSRMKAIEETIANHIATQRGEPAVLYEAAYHLIRAGGKRIRSLISMLACEAVGGKVDDVIPITLVAELLQTASLIHDDIIDNDETRRGVVSVHRVFGLEVAILAGDLLISQAVKLLGEYGNPDLLKHMGEGGSRMCEGEAADLYMSPSKAESFTEANYLSMIERKTVAFVEEAVRIGALIGKSTEKQLNSLMEYARALGVAFQFRDDILDIVSCSGVTGKSSLSDIRLGRGNYVIIKALNELENDKRERCLAALAKGNTAPILKAIEKTDAINLVSKEAAGYVERAKEALNEDILENTDILAQIADFALDRDQ